MVGHSHLWIHVFRTPSLSTEDLPLSPRWSSPAEDLVTTTVEVVVVVVEVAEGTTGGKTPDLRRTFTSPPKNMNNVVFHICMKTSSDYFFRVFAVLQNKRRHKAFLTVTFLICDYGIIKRIMCEFCYVTFGWANCTIMGFGYDHKLVRIPQVVFLGYFLVVIVIFCNIMSHFNISTQISIFIDSLYYAYWNTYVYWLFVSRMLRQICLLIVCITHIYFKHNSYQIR